MPRVCGDLQWAASFAPGGGSRSAIFGQVSWSLRCSTLHFPHRRVSWHLHMEKHLLLISLNNIWVVGCSTEKSNSCVSSHLKAAHLCKTLVDRSWISGEKTRKRCIFFSSAYKIGGRDAGHFSLFGCALLCDARTDLKLYQPGGPLPLTAGLLLP